MALTEDDKDFPPCSACNGATEITFVSSAGKPYVLRLVRHGDLVHAESKRPWNHDYLAVAAFREGKFHALLDFGFVRDGMAHVPATHLHRGSYSPETITPDDTARLSAWARPHQIHAYNDSFARELFGRPLVEAEE